MVSSLPWTEQTLTFGGCKPYLQGQICCQGSQKVASTSLNFLNLLSACTSDVQLSRLKQLYVFVYMMNAN